MSVIYIRQRNTLLTSYGDILPSATLFGGLQAYNGAYATGTNKAVNLTRVSDSTSADFNILKNGRFDIASANAFAGVDATAIAAAVASTILTLTGASSTPHVGSTIAAATNQPCYIVSVGSFAGGSGTVVVNQAQTMTSLSISMQYGLSVAKIYDQTGNGWTMLPNSTAPWLYPSGINGKPAIDANQIMRVSSSLPNTGQPLTYFIVGERYANFTSEVVLLGAPSLFNSIGPNSSTNSWFGYAGTQSNFTVSDSVAHAVTVVMNSTNGATNVDGTDTTSVNFGTGTEGNTFDLGNGSCYAGCFGLWPSAATPTQRGSFHTIASSFWSTP